MKAHNLIESSTQIDPIDHRIKGFSFREFKDKIWHSRRDFFLLF